jgi:hypothetical protein
MTQMTVLPVHLEVSASPLALSHIDHGEHAGLDRLGKQIPRGHDTGQIGRELRPKSGLGRVRHLYGHPAGLLVAYLSVGVVFSRIGLRS